MKSYKICVLPGDGIGLEVIAQAVKILKVLPCEFEFTHGEIGYDTYLKDGDPLPKETIEKVGDAEATLFGAVTTPPHIPGYSSPIVRLRKEFDLYANVRPCRSLPTPLSRPDINMIIVRENTEDLYSGIERVEEEGNRAIGERIITRKASERIVRHAFRLAEEENFSKVTVVHKANVLRETCGLFRKVAFEIAQEFPHLTMEEMLVDACAMKIVKNPSQFQVIVTSNMFGDILSDEASMLVGGLGIVYSGNIGEKTAVFEPVHGSAPKYAGRNIANPIAAIMASKMMLEFLGEKDSAAIVENAVIRAIRENKVTHDLGGNLTMEEVTRVIVKLVEK